MTNFLATYFLHSTILLSATWLAMRIARPRSPVLVERVWKLASVLPIVTALAMSCWPVANHSEPFAAANSSGTLEAADEASAEMPLNAATESRVFVSEDMTASPPITESPHETDPRPNVPVASEVAGETRSSLLEADDWRMGTLAGPLDGEVAPEGTGKSAQPPSDVAVPEGLAITAASDSPHITETEAPASGESAEPGAISIWQAICVLLPTWSVFGAMWLAIRSAWFRWRLRNARRVERGRAVELLRELSSLVVPPSGGAFQFRLKAGLRTRVLIAPNFAEPAAFGLFRSTIVLPPSCESLDRAALRAVLAHELAHLARGDVWWLTIGRVLTTVLGFQPLNRIARREWTQAAECLCDDWAVGRGVERLTLARCLTALAEHRLTGVALADALTAVGSPSSLRTRVERLVAEPTTDPWSKRSRRWLVTGSVVVAAIVTAMTLPLPEIVSTPAVADDADAALLSEIESELSGLRTELQHAAQLAAERDDPAWLEAAEMLRERERRIVEQWQSLECCGSTQPSLQEPENPLITK